MPCSSATPQGSPRSEARPAPIDDPAPINYPAPINVSRSRRLAPTVSYNRQFSSDVAHELGTPLAAIRVHLEEALRYPEDADPHVALQQALHATERLQAIVTDLLLLAQLGTGEAAPHGPVDLTCLVAAETGRRSSARIRTVLEQQITVLGDGTHLTRLLGNLLDNAERHARTAVDVRLSRHDGHAVLTVTDDGAGIPAKDRRRVFEPFARLDSARDRNAGGAGLGLTVAGDIALAHNGTLTIEDSPRGARFALRIPLADTGPGMRWTEIRR